MEINLVNKLLNFTLLGAEWVLWLLVFLSIVSIAVIIERSLFFSKMRIDFPSFLEDLSQQLSKKKYQDACEYCAGNPSMVSKAAYIGLKSKIKDEKTIQANMESLITQERHNMDRGLVILGTLGNNAPFIGLFGTVIGIIKAFHDLAQNPEGGPSVVMAGVSEALVATAVGILVAIPAVIAFNFFNRLIKKHTANARSLIKTIEQH